MKIKYAFQSGVVTEVEVSDEIGAVIIELDRQEYNVNHKETRRHCSLDAFNLDDALFPDLLQSNPDIMGLLEDPEDWPEDGEDALPDDQIPEPAVVPVSLFPESRPRRKWPWIAAGTVLLLTAGGAALWKTGLWARLLERLP